MGQIFSWSCSDSLHIFSFIQLKPWLMAFSPYFIAISMTKMLLRVKLERSVGCMVCDLISSGGFRHFCLSKLLQYFQLQTYQILFLNAQIDACNKSEHKRNMVKLDLFSFLREPESEYKPPSKTYVFANQRV